MLWFDLAYFKICFNDSSIINSFAVDVNLKNNPRTTRPSRSRSPGNHFKKIFQCCLFFKFTWGPAFMALRLWHEATKFFHYFNAANFIFVSIHIICIAARCDASHLCMQLQTLLHMKFCKTSCECDNAFASFKILPTIQH